jgi:hypothetical protein
VTIDDQLVILGLNRPPEAAVDRVILEHVDLITRRQSCIHKISRKAYHIVQGNKGARRI